MDMKDETRKNIAENYYPFPCDKCGLCCRFVNYVDEMKGYDKGDGTCRFLQLDNTCQIYSHRPDVCNGKYIYEKFYRHMSVIDFHRMISRYCQEIKEGKFVERLSENVSKNG
ncbi:YkgJ family cysteine cluster protein [Selenomonas sp. KH1T6]|uniref:YkgJ family cysteine cluster protein n=1 Tax=Selenomonas sp. KH1T6 TaxID=3158784 RepID=UPI001114CEAD